MLYCDVVQGKVAVFPLCLSACPVNCIKVSFTFCSAGVELTLWLYVDDLLLYASDPLPSTVVHWSQRDLAPSQVIKLISLRVDAILKLNPTIWLSLQTQLISARIPQDQCGRTLPSLFSANFSPLVTQDRKNQFSQNESLSWTFFFGCCFTVLLSKQICGPDFHLQWQKLSI